MVQQQKRLRIGLIANRAHQDAPDSALVQLLQQTGPALEQLGAELIVVGRTLDAIQRHGLLPDYPHLIRFPYGREGGLMKLVARVVEHDPLRAVDAVIYLIDPVDPSSVFPEAAALKRQCVIHRKPFLTTLASAREWLQLSAAQQCGAATGGTGALPGTDFGGEAIALIAHDAMKPAMLQLVRQHFPLLQRFGRRYATGTTGGQLNLLAAELSGTAQDHWTHRCLSGPLGGDAQLAEMVLDRQIRRIIFLEDPHVARQHEADIQLLERAARTVGDFAQVVSEAGQADRWLQQLANCAKPA